MKLARPNCTTIGAIRRRIAGNLNFFPAGNSELTCEEASRRLQSGKAQNRYADNTRTHRNQHR